MTHVRAANSTPSRVVWRGGGGRSLASAASGGGGGGRGREPGQRVFGGGRIQTGQQVFGGLQAGDEIEGLCAIRAVVDGLVHIGEANVDEPGGSQHPGRRGLVGK